MLLQNNRKLIIFIIIMAILTTSCTILVVTDKPNIHEATIEELQDINGIGEVLSLRVISYLKLNKNATIEDLEDVRGIGEKRIELIKEVYD